MREQLQDFKRALQQDLGRRASYSEILSALLSGVPLWQAAAMLTRIDPETTLGQTTTHNVRRLG